MPVLDVEKDPEGNTMTVTAVFAAPVERVWSLYADARKLERHWGPPGWPATFVEHDFVPGARSHYFMAGPDGERPHGVWSVVAVDEPRSFEIEDAFADEQGTRTRRWAGRAWPRGSSRSERAPGWSFVSTFQSAEQLQQMLDMGMEEGLEQAMGQIDGLLRGGRRSR